MDDFLTQLYEEEQEKVASADLQGLFDQFSVDELTAYLGMEKTAESDLKHLGPRQRSALAHMEAAKGSALPGLGGALGGSLIGGLLAGQKGKVVGAAGGLVTGSGSAYLRRLAKAKAEQAKELGKKAGIPGPDEAPMPSGGKGEVVDRAAARQKRGEEVQKQVEADSAQKEKASMGCAKHASLGSKALKGLGIAAGVGMGAAVYKGAKTWADPSFRRMVFKQNPKKKDLERAFESYEKDTGKSRNDMSMKDISSYVGKTKKASAEWADEMGRFMAHQVAGEIEKEAGIADIMARSMASKGLGKGLGKGMASKTLSSGMAKKMPGAGMGMAQRAAQSAAKRSPFRSAAANLAGKARSLARPATQRAGNLLSRI